MLVKSVRKANRCSWEIRSKSSGGGDVAFTGDGVGVFGAAVRVGAGDAVGQGVGVGEGEGLDTVGDALAVGSVRVGASRVGLTCAGRVGEERGEH
jgi:hypothetical protein